MSHEPPPWVNYRFRQSSTRMTVLNEKSVRVELVVLLQQAASNDQPLDLAGALVNLCNARVPVVSLRGHIRHVAHAAEHLDGLCRVGQNAIGFSLANASMARQRI